MDMSILNAVTKTRKLYIKTKAMYSFFFVQLLAVILISTIFTNTVLLNITDPSSKVIILFSLFCFMCLAVHKLIEQPDSKFNSCALFYIISAVIMANGFILIANLYSAYIYFSGLNTYALNGIYLTNFIIVLNFIEITLFVFVFISLLKTLFNGKDRSTIDMREVNSVKYAFALESTNIKIKSIFDDKKELKSLNKALKNIELEKDLEKSISYIFSELREYRFREIHRNFRVSRNKDLIPL